MTPPTIRPLPASVLMLFLRCSGCPLKLCFIYVLQPRTTYRHSMNGANFDWKGSGMLFFVHSHWEVLGYGKHDAAGLEWVVTCASSVILTSPVTDRHLSLLASIHPSVHAPLSLTWPDFGYFGYIRCISTCSLLQDTVHACRHRHLYKAYTLYYRWSGSRSKGKAEIQYRGRYQTLRGRRGRKAVSRRV